MRARLGVGWILDRLVLGFRSGISGVTEERDNLLLGRSTCSGGVLALARQGSSSWDDDDRHGFRLNRSHGVAVVVAVEGSSKCSRVAVVAREQKGPTMESMGRAVARDKEESSSSG